MMPRRTILLLLPIMFFAAPAVAHHILGIPHYSYDEDYPQTPVLTYRVEAGSYDVKMTGYPGRPAPGDRCSLHLYIHQRSTGELLNVPVTMTVTRDRMFREDPVVYGPMTAELDERVYKFHPRFDAEADYLVRVEFQADGAPWTIDLPMVVGEPGSPLTVLAVSFGAVGLFLVSIRAARIKLQRSAGRARDRRSISGVAREARR